MGKKLTSLVLALLLCCAMVIPSSGAGNVYFVALYDTNILEVNDETMPFWDGGYLYVDSRVFKNMPLPQGTLYHTYNTSKGMLALYVTESVRSMVFNLTDNTTVDNDGNFYHRAAIKRGDVVFLPIALVANYFDLRYSVTQVPYGTLVRLTVEQKPTLNDREFADAALDQVRVRYQDYTRAQTSTQPPAPDVTPPIPVVPPVPESNGKDVYLSMLVQGEDPMEWMVDLDNAGYTATFFFTQQALETQGDFLRALRAKGHVIGLAVTREEDTSITDALSAANDALFQATTTVTRLCWVDNPTPEEVTAVEAAGYSVLIPDIATDEDGLSTASHASHLMAKVDDGKSGSTVWLGEGTTTVGKFLSYLKRADDRTLALNPLVLSD